MRNAGSATLIPRDGVGPEIIDMVAEVFQALGEPFAEDFQQGGYAGWWTARSTRARCARAIRAGDGRHAGVRRRGDPADRLAGSPARPGVATTPP
jgi:hypothetical protein